MGVPEAGKELGERTPRALPFLGIAMRDERLQELLLEPDVAQLARRHGFLGK